MVEAAQRCVAAEGRRRWGPMLPALAPPSRHRAAGQAGLAAPRQGRCQGGAGRHRVRRGRGGLQGLGGAQVRGALYCFYGEQVVGARGQAGGRASRTGRREPQGWWCGTLVGCSCGTSAPHGAHPRGAHLPATPALPPRYPLRRRATRSRRLTSCRRACAWRRPRRRPWRCPPRRRCRPPLSTCGWRQHLTWLARAASASALEAARATSLCNYTVPVGAGAAVPCHARPRPASPLLCSPRVSCCGRCGPAIAPVPPRSAPFKVFPAPVSLVPVFAAAGPITLMLFSFAPHTIASP